MSKEDEVRFHRRQIERVANQLREARADTIFGEWALAATTAPEDVVTAPRDEDYALPDHFAKTVPAPELHELRRLLSELRGLRAQLVGLGSTELLVLYNGDELSMLLEAEFSRWAVAHLRRRLARPSPKDRGSAMATWDRLMTEFGWWFEELGVKAGSGHHLVLNETRRRVPWELYQHTLARHVKRGAVWGECTIEGLPPVEALRARHTVDLFQWGAAGLVDHLFHETRELGASITGSPASLRAELAVVAADLVEIKGLLARGYVPEERGIELPGGLVGMWEWELGHKAGSVHVARPGRGDDGWLGSVMFGLDGRPQDAVVPWLELGDELLPWAVGLLRPVHAALVDAWMRVERPARDAAEPADALAESEVVAAACEVLAQVEPLEDDVQPQGARGPRPRVPAVRTITLLALLERRFGCEVKQGKGSEITVWRPGGRKFTLPAHKRNWHYPAHLVRALLKAVGIPAQEFATIVLKGA